MGSLDQWRRQGEANGITVFSGMIASTCLAVLFVPAFFVVVQRFENWLAQRGAKAPDAAAASQAGP